MARTAKATAPVINTDPEGLRKLQVVFLCGDGMLHMFDMAGLHFYWQDGKNYIERNGRVFPVSMLFSISPMENALSSYQQNVTTLNAMRETEHT